MNVREHVGRDLGSFVFDVERSQLKLFARAVGETRAIYIDKAAAGAAGYRDILAPPTFAFTIGMNPDDPFDLLKALDVDLANVLHGEQSFEYMKPICAGDRVRVRREVVDAYQKKGGALTFYVVGFRFEAVTSGEPYCLARQVMVVRSEAPKND